MNAPQPLSVLLTNGDRINGFAATPPTIVGQRIRTLDGRVLFLPWTNILWIEYPDEPGLETP